MRKIERTSTFLFVSTLVICLVSVAAMGVVSYISVRQSSRADVAELADSLLESAGTQFSFYLGQARNITYRIFEDEAVKALVGRATADPFSLVAVGDDVNNTFVLHDYIHSVYVCKPTEVLISRTPESFPPESFSSLMSAITGARPLIPIPREIVGAKGRVRKILTLYYHGFGYPGGEPDRFVIVNVDAEHVSTLLAGARTEKTVIAITGSDGVVLAAANTALIGETIPVSGADTALIQEAISSVIELPGRSPLVRTASFKEGRLYGVYLGESAVVTPGTAATMTAILLGAIAVAALATGIVLWLSRRLYRPISSVFDAGADSLGARKPKDRLISLADRIVKHLDDLSGLGQQLLTVTEHTFLRRCLVSTAPMSEEVVAHELTRTGLIEHGVDVNMQLIVMRVDQSRLFVRDNTFSTIRGLFASIRADCDLVFHGYCRTMVVEMGDDHLAVLCSAERADIPIDSVIHDRLPALSEHLPETYGISVTSGLSAPFDHLGKLRDAYNQAFGLTNYRLLLGSGRIIQESDIGTPLSGSGRDDVITARLEQLVAHTKSGDSSSFTDCVNELLSHLESYAYDDILSVISRVAYTLSNLRTQGLDGRDALQVRYVDLYDELAMAENMHEFSEALLGIYDRVSANFESVREHASDHAMQEALEYIRANLTDPALSASNVAERLGITPQYFSQVFHRATGKNFPQYLNDLRLGRAYTLLRTDRRAGVQAICRAVGYSSRNHFTALFKAKYAVTPSQMRQSSLDLAGHGTVTDEGAGGSQ